MNPEHPLVVWVVGPPGAGKTTLIRTMLNQACAADPEKLWKLIPKPKWTIVKGLVAAGHYKGDKFDGADTVPYNGAHAAFEYWLERGLGSSITILDGDRFSDERALNWWNSCGCDTRCISLQADDELLTARRTQRGSTQNESWMNGRATKAKRFSLKFPRHHQLIGAGWPLDAQIAAVYDFLKE